MAKTEIDSPYKFEYSADYRSDWDIHRDYINNFDAWEAMLIGQVYDSVSGSVDGSKITDSYSTTLAKERADRVIAKLPDGQTTPAGKSDVGKAAFMDILRQKWIYPNANAQHPYLEKLNMWQLYSSVYGYMPMFYDWNVSSSGYVGPDCWLWNPRNLVPQQGRTSISDMDYVTALTWVGKRYLQNIIDDKSAKIGTVDKSEDTVEDGWNLDALKFLAERARTATSTNDIDKDTKIARDRTIQSQKRGICLATRYESGPDGEWVTFAPDYGYTEVRRIKNPHKNGRIPFVIKYSQPLFDSFYGLGDFQRSKPLQFARDGLTNFYFKGIKMNLIPPIIANANGVMKHTLDYREGAVMMETIPNSIRRLETSTAGLATYQAAQSNLTGSLLSLYGSQNASLPGSESLNPSQGKTPQAINLYSDKEATRDGAERRHLEAAIEQLTDGFFSLIVNIGTETIPVTLFGDDLEDIRKSGLGDITDLFKDFKPNSSMTAGDLHINPASLKGVEYRFSIATDSTMKVNKAAQRQAVTDAIGMIGKMQNVFQDDPRLDVHWERIMASYEELSDVPGASEWITFDENGKTKHDLELEKQKQAAMQSQQAAQPQEPQLDPSDLVKLYLGTNNVELRNELLTKLGFQPTETEETTPDADPVISSSGHAFNNPAIAGAADKINDILPVGETPEPQEEPEATQPTVSKSGNMFQDESLGKVADSLSSM